jgi:anti-anti-sigma factor
MPAPNGERLQIEEIGDVTVVRLNGPRLATDEDTEATFARLFALVEDAAHRKLVLDLGSIEYFASAALGKLVTLNRKAHAADARLVLCRPTPPVQRILQLTRLNDVLLTYDSEDEARQSFK